MPDVLHMGVTELIQFLVDEAKIDASSDSERYNAVTLSVANAGSLALLTGSDPLHVMILMFVAGKVCERQGWHLDVPETEDESPFAGED